MILSRLSASLVFVNVIMVAHGAPEKEEPTKTLVSATASTNLTTGTHAVIDTGTNSAESIVQNGRLLFQRGKLQEAEATFQAALQLDPRHRQSAFYLSLIDERKRRRTSTNDWNPGFSELIYPTLPTGLVEDGQKPGKIYYIVPGKEEILRKLQTIRLNKISFDDLPLSMALKQLSEATKERDSESKGITFTSSSTNANVTVKLALRNVRVADVVDAIIEVTESQLKYSVEETGVVFTDMPPEPPPQLFIKTFNIDLKAMTNAFSSMIGLTSNVPVDALREYLKAAGVDLAPPRSLCFNETRGMILVSATQEELNTVGAAIDVINSPPPEPAK